MNRFERYRAEKRAAQLSHLTDQGRTLVAAEAELQSSYRLEAAARFLHGELFPEEYDFMGDSYWEKQQRDRGISPVDDAHTALTNAKRHALRVPELDVSGLPLAGGSWDLCERLVLRLRDVLDQRGVDDRRNP
jgi:hypothetical protein